MLPGVPGISLVSGKVPVVVGWSRKTRGWVQFGAFGQALRRISKQCVVSYGGVPCNDIASGLFKFSWCQIMSISNSGNFTLLGHLFFLNCCIILVFNITLRAPHMKDTLFYSQSKREITVIQHYLQCHLWIFIGTFS